MNTSKCRLKGLSAILLLLLLAAALLPVSGFAAELPTTTAAITVEKKLTGDTPPSAETFAFTLTPDDASYPMPEGTNGNVLTIQGAGIASFGAITYSEPNTYTYTVRETPGNAPNYTYDETIYKTTVFVTTDDAGTLSAKVWVTKDTAGSKSANAVFTNNYKRTSNSGYPQTGDTNNLTLWIVLAGVSAASLLILLIDNKRKKKSIGNH